MKNTSASPFIFSVLVIFAFGTWMGCDKDRGRSGTVYVKCGNDWRSIEELESAARMHIESQTTKFSVAGAEINTWIDGADPTNYVMFAYSSGLGKPSALVEFDDKGVLTGLHIGIATSEHPSVAESLKLIRTGSTNEETVNP